MDSELRQRKKEKPQGESKGRKSPPSQKGSKYVSVSVIVSNDQFLAHDSSSSCCLC